MFNNFKPTHGLSHLKEYGIWKAMKDRCINSNNPSYFRYGGRGISYCERWEDVNNFIEDMGLRPSEFHTLERKDNNGNYEKDNCYWATRKEQARNFRFNNILEYNGEKRCVSEWAEILGIHRDAIFYRLKRGYTTEQALTGFKQHKGERINFNGEILSIKAVERKLGVAYGTIRHRIKAGYSIQEAVNLPYRYKP